MKHDLLKLEVERIICHWLTSANEFEQLSHLLLSHTHERLSPTTLKRLWGYKQCFYAACPHFSVNAFLNIADDSQTLLSL